MTLSEAKARIGSAVVYNPGHAGARPEQGVITSVGSSFVFVRYGEQQSSNATRPEHLSLVATDGAA